MWPLVSSYPSWEQPSDQLQQDPCNRNLMGAGERGTLNRWIKTEESWKRPVLIFLLAFHCHIFGIQRTQSTYTHFIQKGIVSTVAHVTPMPGDGVCKKVRDTGEGTRRARGSSGLRCAEENSVVAGCTSKKEENDWINRRAVISSHKNSAWLYSLWFGCVCCAASECLWADLFVHM